MEYLLLLASVLGFVLSYRSFVMYKKYKYSGRVPKIRTAKQNSRLYLVLGLVSIVVFFVIIMF